MFELVRSYFHFLLLEFVTLFTFSAPDYVDIKGCRKLYGAMIRQEIKEVFL